MVTGCEASLRRLQTDWLDLYRVHEWDGSTPLEETLEALSLLVDQGKVRYVGVSNFAAWQLMNALGISDARRLPRFIAQQVYYSLQERSLEYELVPLALDQGLGTFAWSPLAGGLLSGKFRRGQDAPEGSRGLSDWGEPPVYDEDALSDDDLHRLDEVSRPDLLYPYWHQMKTGADRLGPADLSLIGKYMS